MPPAQRYSAVIFDLDGTLVDSCAALTDAVNCCLLPFGRAPLTTEQLRGYVGEGVETLLARCFSPGEVPRDAARIFEERYDEICCEQSRMLEDVDETIASLADRGIRMGVCTNKPTAFSRKILEHFGVAPYFSAIVGPDLAGARKPEPAHVRYVLAALSAAPAEALFVGDMPIDVRAARNAGVDVAVIATGSSSAETLRQESPDFFLQRFSDLVEVVLG